MTYRKLLDWINTLSNTALEREVMVCQETPFDECAELKCLGLAIDTDTLNNGHPIIIIEEGD